MLVSLACMFAFKLLKQVCIACRHLSRCCMFVFMFSELFQKLGGMLVSFACSVVFNLFVNYVGNCSHLGCHNFLKYV